ncbi:arginyl-tRNA synthetase [Malassezia pachydermatis]|uniref:arginine--tRNA ligase n=1 Tax=Malassezia pachydermatis TaxID=77020 RepID=A0A0M8MVS8_9BASI|nr:arginyl-trna synthetase [Malassezia pachydermatis]KOS14780.1 arginyl-trna synthetase [Malassezia pachydermatis]
MSHPPVPSKHTFAGVPFFQQLPKLPSLEGTDAARAPQDAFRLAIAAQLSEVLGISLQDAFLAVAPGGKEADFKVVLPRFRLPAKIDELQAKVLDAFQPNEYIESVSKQGPAVLYKVNKSTLVKLVLSTVHAMTYGDGAATDEQGNKQPSYGSNYSGDGKSVIVEFSSPNIAKPFHAGHLRSTIIGAFLANLYEANGWQVRRFNYLGDWGKQFGLLALGWRRFGDEAKLKADPVQHLFDVYVEINRLASEGEEGEKIHEAAREFFKGMEEGKEENLTEWRRFRELSIEKYKETYARLNVHFDEYRGESSVKLTDLETTLQQLREAPFTTREENGALLADLTPYKLEKAVIERKDGTPLYLTRDIREAAQRYDQYHFDKMIYVIASQQDLHAAQLFKILELMGYPWAKKEDGRLLHINFGMVQGMSTRKGTVVFLDHILNETKDAMHDVMRKNEEKYAQLEDPEGTADIVGMTAIKIQDMAGKRINNYAFDWKRMFSFEGDTGPYLQYNHVRLCSMERTNAEDGLVLPKADLDLASMQTDRLASTPEAIELVWLIAQWPDVVRTASRDHQASTIVTYCFKLTHAISSAWEKLIVKGQEREEALVRLWLYRCAKDVLGSALRLLTITPLERM